MQVRKAINTALDEELEHDERVFLLGEDIGKYDGPYKVTKGLYMSGGLLNCPIVFRGANGISSGTAAQHSQCFATWYSQVPGLKVVSIYNCEDARGLLKSAVRDLDPVIVFENELIYNDEYDVSSEAMSKDFLIPIASNGIQCEVINLRSLRPMDYEAVFKSVQKTNHLITVEQGWPQNCIGSDIIRAINEDKTFFFLDAPVICLTGVDVPMPYSLPLEDNATPQPKHVIEAVNKILNKK
ncbi:Pyruvate dehydrogenase E1 component subunit beta [Blattella germanica]|nr:Pyruvate dehydrogenase E1 component subunit beta [Blattella germanica]